MMKRFAALLLAVMLLLAMTACGEKNSGSNSGNDQVQTGTADPADKEKPAETPSDNKDEDKAADNKEPEEQRPEAEQPEEEKAPEITASHSDVTLKSVGSSFRFTEQGTPGIYACTYTSEDETIATVAEDGTVTAVAPGTTSVTMHIEYATGQVDFTCIVRCVWEENGNTASGVDLSAYFNGFMDSLGEGNTPAVMELPGDVIDAYYPGLNDVAKKQSVMQMAAMMQVAFEFALVECENASDVETVKTIFRSRVDSQAGGGGFYPMVEEAWSNADILVNGNIVALIVAGEQQDNAVASFNALF